MDKKKLPVKLLVVSSLTVFLVLSGAYFYLLAERSFRAGAPDEQNHDRFYLKTDEAAEKDPFLTKIPGLADMLAGPIITGADPSLGNPAARVVIVIFSDYTCDFCRELEAVIASVLPEYGDKVRLVWKDYPEASRTSTSWLAAVAARCAGAQGRYWEYHDQLYASDGGWAKGDFIGIADSLGLSQKDFSGCFEEESPAAAIRDNMEEADALGIMGVPYVFVNDKAFLGQVSVEELRMTIDYELK